MTETTRIKDTQTFDPFYTATIKVYTASKLKHAALLRQWRDQNPTFHFTARWIVTANLASESQRPASQWLPDNFDDIVRSQYVISYVQLGEQLKTALGECFYGLAYGKPLWLVTGKPENYQGEHETTGDHPDYLPWAAGHRLIHRAFSMEQALTEIRQHYTAVRGQL